MAGVYLSSPRSNSGGRYHSVITLLVYGRLDEKNKKHIILVNNLMKMEAKNNWKCAVNVERACKIYLSSELYSRARPKSASFIWPLIRHERHVRT